MSFRRTIYLAWATGSLFVLGSGGCGDQAYPMRTTVQTVCLRLVDAKSERPVVAARLLLKHELTDPQTLTLESGAEWQLHEPETWDQQPWFPGLTDQDGKADIVVKYRLPDQSPARHPPAWRDWVTGKRYAVRVKKQSPKPDDWPEERVSLLMAPGDSAGGRTVTVTVLEISAPRYVETK